jgi:hypothetical protein
MDGTSDPRDAGFRRIDAFREANALRHFGSQLVEIRRQAVRFKDVVKSSGSVDFVRTEPLKSLPYPAQFGFFRARTPTTPFLTITNQLIVIRYRDLAGQKRVLLFSPSDHELGRNTPFFAQLTARMPAMGPLEKRAYPAHGTVLSQLAKHGIAPEEVDYLAFDHLHTQDIRRLLGTTKPQADLSPDAPLPGWFPNAKLVVHRAELALLEDLHPLQKPWYQPWTYGDLRRDRIMVIEDDLLLGAGLALLQSPGHSAGNQSLVVNTSTGLWVSSENVIATECLTPEHSAIPGFQAWTKESGEELVMNGSTMEGRAEQYNSSIKEKLIADPSAVDPRFVQFFPSSELTATWLNPLARPTFSHGSLTHG